MALRIKRGTNAERLSYTPELGELIYVPDYSGASVGPLWVGDGTTVGGNQVSSGSGGGGGGGDVVDDTTPQLGGNLDLNSFDITGTGDIDTTGNINATGSIDVNLNIDAGGYVNATSMAANLFNGSFDGDLSGSVYGDDSTVLVDGNNNKVLASVFNSLNNVMVDVTSNTFSGGALTLSSDSANIIVDSTITSTNGVALEARGHNGTIANKTVLTAGDTVYNFISKGYDGDSYTNSAIIKMGADKYTTAIADGIMPGRIVFLTYNESGGTGTDNAMVFNRFGYLGIKTDQPLKALDVRGDGIFSGNLEAASITGTVVADDSTILVDGVAGKVNLAPNTLSDLGNVTIGTPQAGQVLKYNGSAWVNDVDVVGSGGSGGGIGNIGVGADDSAIRLINSGESFKILGAGNISTSSNAEGDITVTGVTELSGDTSPVLGGNMTTGTYNIKFGDAASPGSDDTLIFGAGDDLQIYHTGTASVIKDAGDGGLQILSNLLEIKNAANDEVQIDATEDGGVRLYYNGSSKLQTTTNGVTITGTLTGDVTGNVSGTAGGVAWSGVTSTPTTLAGYGITDAATSAQGTKADSALQPAALGNYDFTGSTVDTNDSSGMVIIPAVTCQSDLTVENNLTVTNAVIADRFESTSTGTPEITAASNLNLTAGNAVVITQSPVRFASFTTTERDALASANGDMVYNTTTNKFQGYANGAWVDLH